MHKTKKASKKLNTYCGNMLEEYQDFKLLYYGNIMVFVNKR